MRTRLLGLSLVLAACAGDDYGEGSESAVSAEGGEAGESSGGADTDEGSTEGTEGGSGGGSGGEDGASSASETGVDACASSPMDGPCVACLKDSCCTEFEQCEQDPGCACMFECLDAEGQFLTCLVECDLAPADAQLEALGECTQGPCQPACGS